MKFEELRPIPRPQLTMSQYNMTEEQRDTIEWILVKYEIRTDGTVSCVEFQSTSTGSDGRCNHLEAQCYVRYRTKTKVKLESESQY